MSSGIDSGTIACLLKKLGIEFTAFAVGYEERPPSDEREKAIELAKYLGVPVVEIEIKDNDLVKNFPFLIEALELPIADITGYAYYTLFKTMKEYGVTLSVSGQGSDELFFGYQWIRDAVFANEVLQEMRAEHKKSPSLMKMLYFFRPSAFRGYTFRNWLHYLWPLRRQWHYSLDSWNVIKRASEENNGFVFYDSLKNFENTKKLMRELYTEDFRSKVDESSLDMISHLNPNVSADIFLSTAILHTYLLEDGLTQGNNIARNTGGVISVFPFMDTELADAVTGLRKNSHDWKLGRKAWLRKAMRGIVPDFVLDRQKKQGFEPPVARWIELLFREYGHKLNKGFLSGQKIFTDETLELFSRGPEGKRNLPYYRALVLELWGRYMQKNNYLK